MNRKVLLAFFCCQLCIVLAVLTSCATIPMPNCEQTKCGSAVMCNEQGTAFVKNGKPELAECFFKKALEKDRESSEGHLGLGVALAVTGRFSQAKAHFEWVLQRSAEPQARERAASWVRALEDPVPIAVFYLPAEGCEDEDWSLARYAAREVKSSMTRFAPFRAVGDDVLHPTEGEISGALETARFLGARVAVVVRVVCHELSQFRQTSFFGGLVSVHPAVVKTSASATTEIAVYSVRQGYLFDTFAGTGTATNISKNIAILFAINRGIASVIFRVTSKMAIEE